MAIVNTCTCTHGSEDMQTIHHTQRSRRSTCMVNLTLTTQLYLNMHVHTYIHCTYMYTCTAHTRTHAHTQTHTHTQTHAHTNTHTHISAEHSISLPESAIVTGRGVWDEFGDKDSRVSDHVRVVTASCHTHPESSSETLWIQHRHTHSA